MKISYYELTIMLDVLIHSRQIKGLFNYTERARQDVIDNILRRMEKEGVDIPVGNNDKPFED